MTPPEHLFIGTTLANIYYSLQAILNFKKVRYSILIFFSIISAMLPDIDSFYGEYTSIDPIIGHRGVSHSIGAVAVFALLLVMVYRISSALIKKIIGNNGLISDNDWASINNTYSRKYLLVLFLISFIAGLSHLVADLPQPRAIWGGIPVFFPLKSEGSYVRTGGWSLIGWYDYGILLVLIRTTFLSWSLLFFAKVKTGWKYSRMVAAILMWTILITGLFSITYITVHIKNSKYVNSGSWEKKQTTYLDTINPSVKKVIIEGRRSFIQLFLKTTK